jgi:putative DNA primase/helicase
MRPHRREEYHSKITSAAPAQYADCPRFLAFLDRIMAGDDEMMRFIKRIIGYSLTGSTREQALFFAYGSGANGKGVLMNTFRRLLGDYATSTQMETLTVSRGERHPTEVADLKGARLVITSETGEGRWNEARIKQFTGSDPLKARFMHRDFFEFYPNFKLFISGNTMPRLRNVDRAMRRRLLLIPFTVSIPDEEQNKELTDHLQGEWPAILRWALEGCLEWQRAGGLKAPASVTDATEQYFEGEDRLGRWLSECWEQSDTQAFALSGDLFASWKTWADANKEFVGSETGMVRALKDRGFVRGRGSDGRRGFQGLSRKSV